MKKGTENNYKTNKKPHIQKNLEMKIIAVSTYLLCKTQSKGWEITYQDQRNDLGQQLRHRFIRSYIWGVEEKQTGQSIYCCDPRSRHLLRINWPSSLHSLLPPRWPEFQDQVLSSSSLQRRYSSWTLPEPLILNAEP